MPGILSMDALYFILPSQHFHSMIKYKQVQQRKTLFLGG